MCPCWINRLFLLMLAVLLTSLIFRGQRRDSVPDLPEFQGKKFAYQDIAGIGLTPGLTRRDPSDVIRVGDVYYVWYSRVDHDHLPEHKLELRTSGYVATIWYAESRDGGFSWTEIGEALRVGEPGSFDSFAVFTPNIAVIQGRYYLYYTGVKPTPGREDVFENNSHNDTTAIGLAAASSPEGPFERVSTQPILRVMPPKRAGGELITTFDSYRVDDAAVVVRDYDRDGDLEVGLYYKGRDFKQGIRGPALTRMGLAVARSPEGPYIRVNRGAAVLPESHEVLVWPHREGVAAYASFSQTLEFAPDGIDFLNPRLGIKTEPRPNAPGFFRPDLTSPQTFGRGVRWGISMRGGPHPYLVRFEIDLEVRR
jgi:hypothetical protein